jgi:transposase-like protein
MVVMSKKKRAQQRHSTEWRQIIQQWRKSGLSVREFCRRHKIPQTSFYQGRRRLGVSKPTSHRKKTTDHFVEVNLSPLPTSPGGLEIVWSQPPVVKVHSGCDLSLLREALKLLGERTC